MKKQETNKSTVKNYYKRQRDMAIYILKWALENPEMEDNKIYLYYNSNLNSVSFYSHTKSKEFPLVELNYANTFYIQAHGGDNNNDEDYCEFTYFFNYKDVTKLIPSGLRDAMIDFWEKESELNKTKRKKEVSY